MSDGVLEPGNAHRCPTVKGESSVRYVCGECIAGRNSEAWLLKRATHAAMSCSRAPFISGAYRSPALTVTDKRERHIAHSRVARWRTVVPSKRVCAGGFRHPHSCRLPDRSSIWAVMRVFSQPSVARSRFLIQKLHHNVVQHLPCVSVFLLFLDVVYSAGFFINIIYFDVNPTCQISKIM